VTAAERAIQSNVMVRDLLCLWERTGGAIGPEGSLFAFVAVAIAATVMIPTICPRVDT
jgi:hypothetical protein